MLVTLIAGTLNMVLLKYQYMLEIPTKPGGKGEHFDAPWLQAGFMMVGEISLLFIWFFTRTKESTDAATKVPKWVFVVPCTCDLIATALMCMGISLIAVSIVQMCRGTIILFVCAMSAFFLGRRQHPFHLCGVALLFVGICLVATSAFYDPAAGTTAPIGGNLALGISLVIFGQFWQACMVVYEEKIMSKYHVEPLFCVGMEGFFGILICTALLLGFHYLLPGYQNTPGHFYQLSQSSALIWSVIGSFIAVAVFNYSGATITQKASATARTTIQLSSTITIWMVELAVGWAKFNALQLFGFFFVAAGTVLYNRIVVIPFLEPALEATALKGKLGAETKEAV
jgi:drug/metabolite transporter (DMT)-like permease